MYVFCLGFLALISLSSLCFAQIGTGNDITLVGEVAIINNPEAVSNVDNIAETKIDSYKNKLPSRSVEKKPSKVITSAKTSKIPKVTKQANVFVLAADPAKMISGGSKEASYAIFSGNTYYKSSVKPDDKTFGTTYILLYNNAVNTHYRNIVCQSVYLKTGWARPPPIS